MTAISARGTTPIRVATVSASSALTEAPAAIEAKLNYVTLYSSTIFAMTMLFFFGVGFPAAMAYGNAAGWGLGAFCAFWGGPSFGVMASSARVAVWEDKHAAHL